MAAFQERVKGDLNKLIDLGKTRLFDETGGIEFTIELIPDFRIKVIQQEEIDQPDHTDPENIYAMYYWSDPNKFGINWGLNCIISKDDPISRILEGASEDLLVKKIIQKEGFFLIEIKYNGTWKKVK